MLRTAAELSLLMISAYLISKIASSIIGFKKLPRPEDLNGRNKRITIIIPARNEEGKIGECVEHALARLREDDELIVVNDCSTDSTELEALSKMDGRCKLITLLMKPEEWSGKAWACYQGYLHSSGDVLIFLDADTRILCDLDGVVGLLDYYDAVSQVPKIRCDTLACGAFEVALTSLVRLLFPYWELSPRRAWMMGAFMVWRRVSYELAGTHAAVRGSLVEDADLARTALRKGLRVSFFSGVIVESSWVRGWKEAYGTIRRISIAANISKPASALASILLSYAAICVYLCPIAAALGLMNSIISALYLVSAFSYASLSLKEVKLNPISFLIAPLAVILIASALLSSLRRSAVSWKGREYSAGAEESP